MVPAPRVSSKRRLQHISGSCLSSNNDAATQDNNNNNNNKKARRDPEWTTTTSEGSFSGSECDAPNAIGQTTARLDNDDNDDNSNTPIEKPPQSRRVTYSPLMIGGMPQSGSIRTVSPEHSMVDLTTTSLIFQPTPYAQDQIVPRRVSALDVSALEDHGETFKTPDVQPLPTKAQPARPKAVVAKPSQQQSSPAKSALNMKGWWWVVLIAIVYRFCLYNTATTTTTTSWSSRHAGPNSICVSGGGFSGFWFTIGRLQSIQDAPSKDYYCYSAGCLAVVAALGNYSVHQLSDLAFGVQDRWLDGTIGQYEVADDFVSKLLPSSSTSSSSSRRNNHYYNYNSTTHNNRLLNQPNDILPHLNIITTIPNGRAGLKPSIRSPETIEQLREMLVQSAWMYVQSMPLVCA